MERSQILEKVQDIFRDILDEEDITLDYSTTSNDVDEWDSLTHIQLIVAIEKALKLKFTAAELISWKDVGEMIDCIETK